MYTVDYLSIKFIHAYNENDSIEVKELCVFWWIYKESYHQQFNQHDDIEFFQSAMKHTS